MGSFFLLLSDLLSRLIMWGSSLPVGAITALFGAPFFLYVVFAKRREEC
jgi:iron complex transport system permease protein